MLEVAYKLFAAQVYTLCFRLLASVHAAEEATVEVFARFSRELTRRWDEALVANRLRELAIDEAIQRLLGRSRERLGGQAASVGASPATSVETLRAVGKVGTGEAAPVLDSELLTKLSAMLPDDLRVTFVLRDMEGLKDQDIAKYLHVRESEVRSLISRARMELRRLWFSQN